MSTDKSPSGDSLPAGRLLMSLAALVIVLTGFYLARTLVTQVLLAGFLAVICFPALQWLKNRGVPSWLALLIVLAVGVLAITTIGAAIGVSATKFRHRIPAYRENLIDQSEHALGWLRAHGVRLPEFFNDEDAEADWDSVATDAAEKAGDQVTEETGGTVGQESLEGSANQTLRETEEGALGLDAKAFFNYASWVAGMVTNFSANLFVVVILFIFMVIEAAGLDAKVRMIPGYTAIDNDRLRRILDDIRHYLVIKTQVSLLTGFLLAVWLWILGVDFPLLWGLLAFLLNFVPNIGSIIAAIPAVLLALVQIGPGVAVLATLGYMAVNIGIGNFLEPRLLGRGLGLSTLVIFLSLLFWNFILGPIGMLLSVPLTMMLKIALERSDETRWIAVLLSAHVREDSAAKHRREASRKRRAKT